MGMFPYDCVVCGGGYNRCGKNKQKIMCDGYSCKGGQFCWENKCYVKDVKTKKWVKAFYCGVINVEDKKKYSIY